MTDKQIIINGVDVSGCEFYSYIESNKHPHRCSCYEDMYGCSMVCDFSDCCKNCYYKQLKRAENQIVELNKMVEAKEQECERLKEKLKNYEIQEDFNKCQKAQNRFVKEQLNGVFNNLRERDIAVIRGMNKIECKNKECEVE